MTGKFGRRSRRKIEKCQYTDEVADLIARRIRKMPEYKHCTVDSMGPFGLSAESRVMVKDGDNYVGSLAIRYGGKASNFQSFEYVDYSAPKKTTYPKDSIGDMNGFNYVTRPLPFDVDEVVKLVFKD